VEETSEENLALIYVAHHVEYRTIASGTTAGSTNRSVVAMLVSSKSILETSCGRATILANASSKSANGSVISKSQSTA